MTVYKLESEDIEHYLKVLTRSTTYTELEMHRKTLYKLLFLDKVAAQKSKEADRLKMYTQAESDLIFAVMEVKFKLRQTQGNIHYSPKHRKKTNVR